MENFNKPKKSLAVYGAPAVHCNTSEAPYKVLSIEKPTKIRDQICTVLTVPDIEDAERICLTWNEHVLNEKQTLKASIHPYSFRKRPVEKLSIHTIFKNYYNPDLKPQIKKIEPPSIVKNEIPVPVTTDRAKPSTAPADQTNQPHQISKAKPVQANGNIKPVE